MAKKFILLQIVMVTFGVALFFALADLKQRMSKKMQPEDVVEVADDRFAACAFDEFVGKTANIRALRQIKTPYIILPDDMAAVPRSKAMPEDVPVLNVFVNRDSVITRIECL